MSVRQHKAPAKNVDQILDQLVGEIMTAEGKGVADLAPLRQRAQVLALEEWLGQKQRDKWWAYNQPGKGKSY